MRILSLDLATRTGWAFGDSEVYPVLIPLQANVDRPPMPQSGFIDLKAGADTEALGLFFHSFSRWLGKVADNFELDCLVFEQPFVGPRPNQATARKLFGLAAEVERCAFYRAFVCRQVEISKWRKHFIGFTGRRETMKGAALDACANRHWEVTDDNQAEALGILDYYIACIMPRDRAKAAPL